ncbi:crotonase/enoyl-CoA hydratase family protein [Pseudonocardia spinosispora]|uniref:crotonase/enoyl-CoA hydratase family protein n=1 Tax=Pseudonocardia spinosispora TaxID=103441 RepID=UPI0003FBF124|nr:crotonase/enoyl-CoA hydratase family protein [Pseudonocardia spinosispora]
MTETTPSIAVRRDDHLLTITIDRPEVRNAFDSATSHALDRALDILDDDPTLFVGILTGAAATFSSGADLSALARGDRPETPGRGGFGIFRRPPIKPLIAAVEGFAVGGGLELCLACDLIVAGSDAVFGLPEVRHNLVASGGGLFRLPKRLPYHLAMEMALTGAHYTSRQLSSFGLITHITEPGQAMAGATELATRLLSNGPTALAATKEIIFRSMGWSEAEAWDKQIPIAARAHDTNDRREGLRAFAEKRRPLWTGT